MKRAKKPKTSPDSPDGNDLNGAFQAGLGSDRSNIPLWVPKALSYGAALGITAVGIDAEWVFKQGRVNRILSYQFFAISLPDKEWSGIIELTEGIRMSLPRFIMDVIEDGLEKGLLKGWPKMIWLVSHFSLADLTSFIDFADQKINFDSIRHTFTSIGRPLTLYPWDKNRHQHTMRIFLRDTLLLAPNKKQSLDDLGELIGVEKGQLEPSEIEHMDQLLANNPDRFYRYALRDPEISLKYAVSMMALNFEITSRIEIPATLSSLGASHLLKTWERQGIDKKAVLGIETVKEEFWSEVRCRTVRKNRDVPTADRNQYESFATECYHGGRNEQFHFGAGLEDVWIDWDLCGAYPTAMAMIGTPDWNAIYQTRDLDAFQPHVLGFARVKFHFPENTRFPSLPVRTASALLFPLSGECFCCAPEIYLARKMGAALEIITGIVLPADFDARPFEEFILDCTRRRKNYAKGSLEELLWKEIGNGTYGKIAQGLRNKRCFNSRSGDYQELPPSRITNPYFAAFVTSFIRAVIGEILSRLPLRVEVWSATTDGFLSNATPEQVAVACSGPLCERFAQSRLRISGNPTILEIKHQIAQPLGWRTRGQATLKSLPGEKIVLAKAGLKPPFQEKGEEKPMHNDWIVGQFLNRKAGATLSHKTLRNLPEIYKHGGDLVSQEITRRLSMEFDWKRRPDTSAMRAIRGIEHLWFSTLPWLSVEEFEACREAWRKYGGKDGAVLKSKEDLRQFNEFRVVDLKSAPIQMPRKNSARTLAKRMFLRAFTRSLWGLDSRQMSYSEIAAWLSSLGCATIKADIENAKRPTAKLVPNVVPQTDWTIQFVATIREKFPAFQEEHFFHAK